MHQKVQAVLDEFRPYLQADGGDAQLIEVTPEGVVKLHLVGACGSCSSSLVTLKQGLERVIKERIPEITSVESV